MDRTKRQHTPLLPWKEARGLDSRTSSSRQRESDLTQGLKIEYGAGGV